MVTRAAFDNQHLSSEPPEQKSSGASLNLICFLRVYDLFPRMGMLGPCAATNGKVRGFALIQADAADTVGHVAN